MPTITPERVELILQQLDTLPTLSPIAVRLLQLSSSHDATVAEISALVSSDPALATKLLSMCRRASTGLGEAVTTVDRAVVMLGLEALRTALLSVHVYELMEGDRPEKGVAIDRAGLWRRQLAVACAAEHLARESRGLCVAPDEAFTAGLLHGIGKLALASVLPKTYQRVCEYADLRRCPIAEAERALIGIDHHTAGKRLGERWGLPVVLQDVMWLYGEPAAIPEDLAHAPLIRVVTAAVGLSRVLHIGWGGDGTPPPTTARVARSAGLEAASVEALEPLLHAEVAARARDLGLDDLVDADMQLQSIASANRELARLNHDLERRARQGETLSRVLGEITAFHQADGISGVVSVYESIGASAGRLFGNGYFAIVHQSREDRPWSVAELGPGGRVLRQHVAEPPEDERSLRELVDLTQLSASSAGVLGWLAGVLENAPDLRTLRLLPMGHGSGEPALLLHNREVGGELLHGPGIGALTSVWSAALAAASRHDGARRLQEKIADTNRRLLDTQGELSEAESLAMLGRLTAGAAHEMNNPLAIIRGRSQVLGRTLSDEVSRSSLGAIEDATQRLSDLISGLHFFADPPTPVRAPVDLTDLLAGVVREVKREWREEGLECGPVNLQVQGPLRPAYVDGSQLGAAVTELLRNALEASAGTFVELRAETEGPDGRLCISVTDRGRGMDRDTLLRATEPFFSRHEAGRGAGLGLSRARRLIELHGGRLELESAESSGTSARLIIPRWTRAEPEGEAASAA